VSGGAGGFTARVSAFRSASDYSSLVNGTVIGVTTAAPAFSDLVVQGRFSVTAGVTYRVGVFMELVTLVNGATFTIMDRVLIGEVIKL
jgi:hypothetical protein